MGFRDMHCELENGYAVSILHHIKVTSRLDSYFNSIFANKKAVSDNTDLNDKLTVGVL